MTSQPHGSRRIRPLLAGSGGRIAQAGAQQHIAFLAANLHQPRLPRMTDAHRTSTTRALTAAPMQGHVVKARHVDQHVTGAGLHLGQQLAATLETQQRHSVYTGSNSPAVTAWPGCSRTRPSAQAHEVNTPDPWF